MATGIPEGKSREIDALIDEYVGDRIDRRGFFKRAVGLGLSLSAAGTILAACGGGGGGGGKLSLRLPTDLSNMDPANWATFGDWTVMNAVYEGLVTFKPGTYERVNQLAETFKISPDGKVIDFTLKQGIQFHGGFGELTADDVKFTYERAAGLPPYKPAANSGDWGGLKEVAVKDKYSGTIVFNEYFAPFHTVGIESFDGFVLSKKAFDQLGSKLATRPIGTGPYEFGTWTHGQRVTLKKFGDYGGASNELFEGGKPTWDQIDLVVIPEDNSADIALQSGELDFAQISLESVDRFKSNSDFTTVRVPTTNTWYLTMNVEHPKLKDLRVRQAIRAAIDVPTIIDNAFHGLWDRATEMFAPTLPLGHWNGAPVHDQDLDLARNLLKQAGVSGLNLELGYSTDPQADLVVQIIQSNLASAGIKVTLKKSDAATYYVGSPVTAKRELSYWWLAANPDPYYYSSSATCETVGQWNWSQRCDPAFDKVLAQAATERDKASRQKLYEQAAKMWDDDCSEVWIAWMNNFYAHKPDIKPVTTLAGNVLPQYFASA